MTDAERDARFASLEGALADVRAELARLQRPRVRSMRSTGCCPSCGGRHLLHFKRIKEVGSNGTVALSLAKDDSSFWSIIGKSTGVLEAFACKRCRLVEWNAISLDDVVADGTNVVEIISSEDADPATTPYR